MKRVRLTVSMRLMSDNNSSGEVMLEKSGWCDGTRARTRSDATWVK